jgi:hypothetical protein
MERLPSKHEARFQTFYLFLWLFNLFNNLGNLLFAPQKPARFKLQELGQLEIVAWQLST